MDGLLSPPCAGAKKGNVRAKPKKKGRYTDVMAGEGKSDKLGRKEGIYQKGKNELKVEFCLLLICICTIYAYAAKIPGGQQDYCII
ncbi:hypothetical protein SS1G_12400 [Sclerotinia sclerotiorum 1980 UF-70]|uniref:Uncharacterized protein n=1 Tax=Sclerotinia sclerotiorum (strain ATCC 18683 / 1980 / Ss-1) TaxID=665079 RepID=A7F478_SCLS1|nr:hypothetical protein SS1G_12400 [Sclerotinia sclerotiorum 1980 UF-70]EDN97549.1 hypothetical protein SS1G_12400 [Sclerotinia sclerotiorum 1980 UF-70]